MSEKVKEYLKQNIVAILILVICAGISLSLAFNQSIGIDEKFSLEWSVWPMPGFWKRIQLDVCPTYMLLLRYVLLPTGSSLLAGKLFSWFTFVVCLVTGYTFVRKEFGNISFYVFAAFLTGSPLILEKSVEVRMYSISYALLILSGVFAYKIINEGTKKWQWITFVIISVLTAYTHYFSLLSLVLLYCAVLLWFLIKKDFVKFGKMMLCSLAMCVIYGPWLVVIMRQTSSETTSWIPETTSKFGPIRDIFDTHGIQLKMYMMYLVLAITVYAIYKLIRERSEQSYWAAACIGISWILLVFGLVFQIISRPILVDRYMTIPFCLFILGTAYLAKTVKPVVAIIFCIVCALCCIIDYPGLREELYVINAAKNVSCIKDLLIYFRI